MMKVLIMQQSRQEPTKSSNCSRHLHIYTTPTADTHQVFVRHVTMCTYPSWQPTIKGVSLRNFHHIVPF